MFDGIYVQNYRISMKRLIFFNLIKDFTKFFLIVIFSLSLIIWVIQAVNFLDFVSEDGHSLTVYFLYTLFSLPKIVSKLFPFIFFISFFYILLKYEENNELQIFWFAGINKIEFINTIIKASLFYFFVLLLFTIYIVPNAQDSARSFIRSSNIDYFSSLIKEKQFNDTVTNLTIYVEKKTDANNFKNIYLNDSLSLGKSQTIYAKNGLMVNKNNTNFLILYNGKILNTVNDKTNIFSFDKTEFNLSKYTTKTITTPKIQEYNTTKLVYCVYDLLLKNASDNINFIGCNTSSLNILKQEILKRFIKPLYIPVLALIACIVILVSKDHHKFKRYKFGTFIFALSIIIFSEISTKFSGNGNVQSLIFILTPILLFFIISKILKIKTQNNISIN